MDALLLAALFGPLAFLALVDDGAGREWLALAEDEAADDDGDDLAERHGAAGTEGTMCGQTDTDGADGAEVPSHGGHTAIDASRRRGPGLHSARTAQVRRIQGDALAYVLDAGPISRRGLAARLGVAEKIVRDWCAGNRPIDVERLRAVCPGVYREWQSKMSGEEKVA